MYKNLLFFILVGTMLSACSKDGDIFSEVEVIVSSEMATGASPIGGHEESLIKLKEVGNDLGYWNTVHSIDGFYYEVGYEYILLTKKIIIKKPWLDEPSVRYELIKIISKTLKN